MPTRVLALAVEPHGQPNGCAAMRCRAFPGMPSATALSEPLALAQTASLIGLWGMTFLSVAIFASPAVLIDGVARPKALDRARWRRWSLLVAMGVYGAVPPVAAADRH